MTTTFSFDKVNRIITVAVPDTVVTIQDLYNAIRDWEDELVNMDVPKICDASGKEDLGGGLSVGITLKLLNWKLKFADRPGPDWVDCSISGGNLVAVYANNQPMNPIQPSAYVTVTVVKAVSAAIIAEWTQAEKDGVITKTGYIPSDLLEVPTMPELNAAHGSGSWEGATPTQLWSHATRSLTTRNIGSEAIASQGTLETHDAEIKGLSWTDESLKKIFEELVQLREEIGGKTPKSVAQYLEAASKA